MLASPGFGLGNLLVVGQVALSLVLVVAAGLFVRTFASLATRDLGFERNPVLIASINPLPARLESGARFELFRRALDTAAAVPGVESAALSAVTPVSGSAASTRIEVPDGPRCPRETASPPSTGSAPAGSARTARRCWPAATS